MSFVRYKKTGIFKKKEAKHDVEKLILDFWDTSILHEFIKDIRMWDVLNNVFSNKTRCLLALICYRLCYPSAMKYARLWYQGNIARLMFKDIDLDTFSIQYMGIQRWRNRQTDQISLRD